MTINVGSLNAHVLRKPSRRAGHDVGGGSEALRLMIEAAFACAADHAPDRRFVVAKADNVEFGRIASAPVCSARIVFQGRSSLTVLVSLRDRGALQPAASGRFMLVAVDDDGVPVPVSNIPEESRP